MTQDLRYAFRMLFKYPVFTVVAVLSLAIGIGANTAVFSLFNALLLRPRPGVGAPEEIVDVGRTQNGSGFDNSSYPNYVDFRDRNAVFSGLAAYEIEPRPMGLGSKTDAERIFGIKVSGNYFSVLGVRPAVGRFFVREEDRVAGERRSAVLSYDLWQQRFQKDPAIIGQTVTLNGQAFLVVGVAQEDFRGTSVIAPDIWIPIHALETEQFLGSRDSVWLLMVGRLKPGITVDQAQASMNVLAASLVKAYPRENEGKGIAVHSSTIFPGDMIKMVYGFLTLLFAIVALVLLIGCVNFAGMMLARATTRRREVAIRLALGAGRSRLVRQLLIEALLLFVIGGAAALWLAGILQSVLLSLVPQLPVPVNLRLDLDWRVLLFTAAVTIIAAIGSGLLPALQSTRSDLVPALKDETQQTGKLRLRSILVAGQVALSLLLVVGAALFVRSLRSAAAIELGFDPKHVDLAQMDLSLAGYEEKQGLLFADELLNRASKLPDVRSASLSVMLPLSGSGLGLGGIVVTENPSANRFGYDADWNVITPRYFETMGISIVRGRAFQDSDRHGSLDVAIINETMARKLWPGQDPVGKHFYDGPLPEGREREIVGVAHDSKYRSLGEEPRMFVYVPLQQNYLTRLTLLTRNAGNQAAIPNVRALVHQLNPYLPIVNTQSLEEFIGTGLFPQKLALEVAGSLGLVGLLLASIGIYGITAFSVERRTREIGIRMALGAKRRGVMRMVLWQGMRLTAAGMVIGMIAALAVMRLLAGLLYGVSPGDPIAFGAAAMLFLLIAAAASYFPARRAGAIEPTTALRYE